MCVIKLRDITREKNQNYLLFRSSRDFNMDIMLGMVARIFIFYVFILPLKCEMMVNFYPSVVCV